MEDLYIHQNRSKKGCLRIIILIVLATIIGVTWFCIARSRAQMRAERAFERSLEESDVTEVMQPAEEQNERMSNPPNTPPVTAKINIQPDKQPMAAPRPQGPENGPKLIREAERLFADGDYASVRQACLQVLDYSNDASSRKRAEELLGDVGLKMIFTPHPMPEKVDYTIASGDTLGELAKKYGTTVDLIRKSNNIKGSLIRVGDRYRILNGKFSIVVDKSSNDLVLKLNDKFFKRYSVGTGKFAKTPVGDFKITDRVAQPTWWRPDGKRVPFGDPENLLGTHWLSLNIRGYGIHGTWEPDTIGKQASAGCIRMLNNEVEELYTLVPIGTSVTIKE